MSDLIEELRKQAAICRDSNKIGIITKGRIAKAMDEASATITRLQAENEALKAADRDHLSAKRGMETRLTAQIESLQAELAETREECLEQARLLGMGGERELDLRARLNEAREVQGRIAKWLRDGDTPDFDNEGRIAGRQCAYTFELATAIEARDWSKP